MKRFFLLTATLISLSQAVFSQINMDNEWLNGSTLLMREGQRLVYGVETANASYDFIIRIQSLKDGITFSYEMTNAEGTTGTVHMNTEAMTSAVNQHNYFGGGELNLQDQTAVWVSKQVFNNLIRTGSSDISPNGGESSIVLKEASAKHDFQVYNAISGKQMNDISYVYAATEDGSAKYWIHLNENNPLILKMDLGWKIWLKELGKE